MQHPRGFLPSSFPRQLLGTGSHGFAVVEMTGLNHERGALYYVYILASVTSNLEGRMAQRKSGEIAGFTRKYKVKKLLYYEEYDDVYLAITREKEIKRWRRDKKVALFEETNLGWVDLSKDWSDD